MMKCINYIIRGCATSASREKILTDSFGRFHNYLRISLTERCNLRCTYCMPLEGVQLTPRPELLTLDERKRIITLFSNLGVTKLRFTGGEPTVSRQLKDLIAHARNTTNINFIGITTNGLLLKNQLDDLVAAGLTSINISMDSLVPEKFAEITRRDSNNLLRVLSALYAAVAKGISVKVNCVLIRGVNDDEIISFIQLTKDLPVDIRFIELMPFDSNNWSSRSMISYLEVLDTIQQQGIILKQTPKHERDKSDTTKWYTVDGYQGRIGFITSMTSHFCGGCNRMRITADGKLKVCLFGDESLSLRDCLRDSNMNEESMIQFLHASILKKKAVLGGHGSAQELSTLKNRPMILIGG